MSKANAEASQKAEVGGRSDFRPHAIIVPERHIPSPIFAVALIGIEKILRLDIDTSLPEQTYFDQALAKLPDQTIAFGKPIGLTINYAADRAVRFDLKGDVIEVLSEAVRLGEASLFIPPSEEDVSLEIGEALGLRSST
jgi:hypothetical protein